MVSPAPVLETSGGVVLDVKFFEGMQRHCDLWPGQITCLLRHGARNIVFRTEKALSELPFELKIIGPRDTIGIDTLHGHDMVLCSADDHTNLHLAALGRAAGLKTVYVVEYILETRLQIARMDPDRGSLRRAKSVLWNLRQEKRRKAALRAADALQCNGYPSYAAYKEIARNCMMYLDNRMTPCLFCDPFNHENRKKRLVSGAPLRLVYSGRLEPMKGVQDLVPVAAGLRDRGVGFFLDIFGAGRLKNTLRQQIDEAGLAGHVSLHDPVDFASELVPWSIANADIYLCCHKQSDPSCTYLESMGCGLAVAGYGNRMWAELCAHSKAGWSVPLNNKTALIDCLAAGDKDRANLAECCENALTFARAHGFEDEFEKRMQHLVSLLQIRG